jgi:hypothetical protein
MRETSKSNQTRQPQQAIHCNLMKDHLKRIQNTQNYNKKSLSSKM